MRAAQVHEQWTGVVGGGARVHRGEWMLETAEEQEVDRGEQHVGLVATGRRLADQVEQVVVGGDRVRDPLVQG